MSYRVITPIQMNQIWYEFSEKVKKKVYDKIPYQDWKIYDKLINKTNLPLGYNCIIEFISNWNDTEIEEIYVSLVQKDGLYYMSNPFHPDDRSFGQYLYYAFVVCNRYNSKANYEDSCYDWKLIDIDSSSPGYKSRFKELISLDLDNITIEFPSDVNITAWDLTVKGDFYANNTSTLNATTSDMVSSSSIAGVGDYYCSTYTDNTATLTEEVNKFKDKIDNKNKEGNKTMFNFDFGPVNGDYIRMSPYGMAVRNAEGKYVAYDKANGKIMDVDVFNFNSDGLLYKMPIAIKDIHSGDIVIHNKKPMYVKAVIMDDNTLSVIDVYNGESKNIMLSRSMFGFDFATKVVSLLDTFNGGATANSDNPFGNILPLLMLSDDQKFDPMMLLLMGNGNGNMMNNPLMMYALMSKDGKGKNDMLPFLLMMNNGANAPHTCACGGNCDCAH